MHGMHQILISYVLIGKNIANIDWLKSYYLIGVSYSRSGLANKVFLRKVQCNNSIIKDTSCVNMLGLSTGRS